MINLFNKWGIGWIKYNENNGVLLFVVKNDCKFFIVIGWGIEGVLFDVMVLIIICYNIMFYFK